MKTFGLRAFLSTLMELAGHTKQTHVNKLRHVAQGLGAKKNEGLALHCTAKGKKEGVGGKVARFMVAIGYGVGIFHCEHFKKHLNGDLFAKYVETKFPEVMENSTNPQAKLFLQDGDPSQNSAAAYKAIEKLGIKVLKIPARSPDINPIENIFHLVSKQLRKDATEQKITKETYEQFVERCKQTLLSFPVHVVDKTILSMGKRMDLTIKAKGARIKY